MEIDKILFGQLSENRGIDASFEDLDVNNDGRITSADMDVAESADIKNSIANILSAVDEDNDIVLLDEIEGLSSMTKAGGKKKAQEEQIYDTTREQSAKDGIPVTDKANFEKDVLNSLGVTYVILGNLGGCSYCNEVEAVLAAFKDELKDVCNIYNMSWYENLDFSRDLAYNQAGVKPPAGFPCILKFYNGKLVSRVYGGYGNGTNVDARAPWGDTAIFTGYSYIDENGRTQQARTHNRETNSLEWTHTPTLIDLIKQDAQATKDDPNVLKDEKGQLRTSADRFNDDVKGSTGTTYVVMGCIGCNSQLMSEIRKHQSEIDKVANVFQMDWEMNSATTALCRKIAYEMGGLQYPAQFPVVAKFVDGEFVEIIPNTNNNTSWRNDAIQALIDNAEGTPGRKSQNNESANKADDTNDANLEKAAAEKNERIKEELKEIKKKMSEKELMYLQMKNMLEAAQEEYKREKEKLDDAEDVQKSSIKLNMEGIKSRENIYQIQVDAVSSEINQLKQKYIEVSAQLKE